MHPFKNIGNVADVAEDASSQVFRLLRYIQNIRIFCKTEFAIMSDLPQFKAADLARQTSDLFDAAIRSPIAITKHRKPKFVLMSMDQYQKLSRETSQQVYMINEMPEDLKALMVEGLKRDLMEPDA